MNRQLLIIGILFLTVATDLTGQQKADTVRRAQDALGEGLDAYQAGKLDDAIGKVREAYQMMPGNPQARLHLGLFLYLKSNDNLEAQHLMESVLDQFPDHSDLQLKLLDSYLLRKDQPKVSSLLARLQRRMENDSRFAFNVIYTLVFYGQAGPAKSQIDRVSHKLQSEIVFISGLVAVISGQREEALRMFELARRQDYPPSGSLQMLMLAENLFRLQEFKGASLAYQDYLKAFPEATQYGFRLGLCYFGTGEYAKAEHQFREVLEKAPQTPEVNYYLGTVLVELKQNEEAGRFFQAQLKRDPGSFKSMAKLAYLDYAKGEDDQCRRWLDQAMAKDPNWWETHLVFGLLYNRLGDYSQAIKNLEMSLKEEPNYPKTHFQLSLAYQRVGNVEKAKQYKESYDRLLKTETARILEARGMAGQGEQKTK